MGKAIFLIKLFNRNFILYLARVRIYLPSFLHPTHCATLFSAESSIPAVEESASQTGDEDNISQPSATLFTLPQTLQYPVERHL